MRRGWHGLRPPAVRISCWVAGVMMAVGSLAQPGRAFANPGGSATTSPMTAQLCSSTSVPCSVGISDNVREGAATSIDVTGRALASVDVQLFMLDVSAGHINGMTPLGRSAGVRLSARGYGSAQIPIAPFGIHGQGGWVLATLADTKWGDPMTIVGHIASIGARSPTVLGDGYGTAKPVATALDMEITNYISGTRFTVEYLGDDGGWHNVLQSSSERSEGHQFIMTLRYSVPGGLLAKPYRFRAHNVTDPSAIDQEWIVLPSNQALPQGRAPLLAVPRLGSDVTATNVMVEYPAATVLKGIASAVAMGVVAIVVWPAFAVYRRRINVGII